MKFWLFLICFFCSPLFAKRMVSLAPNLTEILFALEAGKDVVGVTNFCNYPQEVLSLPKVGGYSNPVLEDILKLKPDLVLATEGTPREIIQRLKSLSVKVETLPAKTLQDLYFSIEILGKLTEKQEISKSLLSQIKKKVEEVKEFAKGEKPYYLTLINISPLYSVSPKTWMGEIFEIAGFQSILSQTVSDYPQVSKEALLQKKPQMLFIDAMGAPQKEGKVDEKALRAQLEIAFGQKDLPPFQYLPADIFMRPGPRIIEALDFLMNTRKNMTKGK